MRILSVDYGEARTGLAVSDVSEILASPLCIIHEKNRERLTEKIVTAVSENNIEEVIVGNPINMNGTRGPRSILCCEFADGLKEKVNVPVTMWDERNTTVTAHSIMNENNKRGKKRKNTIDAVAAAVLLENYLMYRRNNK